MTVNMDHIYKISDFIRKTYQIAHAASEYDAESRCRELYVTDSEDALFNTKSVSHINMITHVCKKLGLQS